MKDINKIVAAVLVILVGISLVGVAQSSSPVTTVQSSSRVTAAQRTWVLIGYRFNKASSPSDIGEVYDSLPGRPPYSLKSLFDQWKAGIITRQKVRPSLLAYARESGGYEAVESFRLGEWCSRLLAVEKDFKSNVQHDNSNKAFSNMIDMAFLARQAQEFIDTLSGETSKDVLDALNQIVIAGTKIDVAGVLNGTASEDEFATAILSLPRYVAQILTIYLLG